MPRPKRFTLDTKNILRYGSGMLLFRSIIIGSLLTLVVLILGPYLAERYHNVFPQINLGPFRYAGFLLVAAGLPLLVWSVYLLLIPGKNKAVPYESVEDFTPAGPYKYTRNPFMLGFLLILWGEVIFLECIATLIYALLVTWCVVFWIRCCEEPSLEERYGEEYLSYKRKTPRWFPHP